MICPTVGRPVQEVHLILFGSTKLKKNLTIDNLNFNSNTPDSKSVSITCNRLLIMGNQELRRENDRLREERNAAESDYEELRRKYRGLEERYDNLMDRRDRWMDRSDYWMNRATRLEEDLGIMTEKRDAWKAEVEELRELREADASVARVGRAIIERKWTQWKLKLDALTKGELPKEDRRAIEEGNVIAHEPDVLADLALIQTGIKDDGIFESMYGFPSEDGLR
jgi:hypothetical protein